LSLAFIDRASEPYFENNEWSERFTENITGLDEFRQIPEAKDVKNVGVTNDDELFQVFYYIDDTYNEDDAKLFTLDSTTRVLRLQEQLDREEIDQHSFRIIASNQDTKPIPRLVSENAFLYVTINVDDVNDNPPTFVGEKRYSVGITESDPLGKELFRLNATDPDLNDAITYHILTDTIVVSKNELERDKNTAFILDSNDGLMRLNFKVEASTSGFFEFKVEARDLVNHTDVADVKIFIISDSNRVNFQFGNTTTELGSINQVTLATIFSDAYLANCVIDQIRANEENPDEADIIAHFIRDDEAIDRVEIEE
jgi:hypothetical protein